MPGWGTPRGGYCRSAAFVGRAVLAFRRFAHAAVGYGRLPVLPSRTVTVVAGDALQRRLLQPICPGHRRESVLPFRMDRPDSTGDSGLRDKAILPC